MIGMTNTEFSRIVADISEARKMNKTAIARQMGVSKVSLNLFEKNGVPASKVALYMSRIKPLLLDELLVR